MAGKKNKVVISVITNLTPKEQKDLSKAIISGKNRVAPKALGTIAGGKSKDVARLLQNGTKKLLGR